MRLRSGDSVRKGLRSPGDGGGGRSDAACSSARSAVVVKGSNRALADRCRSPAQKQALRDGLVRYRRRLAAVGRADHCGQRRSHASPNRSGALVRPRSRCTRSGRPGTRDPVRLAHAAGRHRPRVQRIQVVRAAYRGRGHHAHRRDRVRAAPFHRLGSIGSGPSARAPSSTRASSPRVCQRSSA
jgi:hypothetical protein